MFLPFRFYHEFIHPEIEGRVWAYSRMYCQEAPNDGRVTVDQKLRFQQNLADLEIRAGRASYPFLKPLMPKALEELRTIEPGSVIVVASTDIE